MTAAYTDAVVYAEKVAATYLEDPAAVWIYPGLTSERAAQLEQRLGALVELLAEPPRYGGGFWACTEVPGDMATRVLWDFGCDSWSASVLRAVQEVTTIVDAIGGTSLGELGAAVADGVERERDLTEEETVPTGPEVWAETPSFVKTLTTMLGLFLLLQVVGMLRR